MWLQHLELQQFRKFPFLTLDFDTKHHIVCFVGANTMGKTNILEAIYFLALLKSFRTSDTKELITWGEHHLSVAGNFQGKEKKDLQVNMVFRPRRQRKFRINEVETTVADYVGNLNVVFFSPDDINLLLLSPANRRKYLDILLSQTDRTYLQAYAHYQKVLKQRNALLKAIGLGKAQKKELQYWDDEIIECGYTLLEKRETLINFFNAHIGTSYREISENKDAEYNIQYLPSLKEQHSSKDLYRQKLSERLERDIILESTSTGPHRDDMAFLLNGKNIDSFASRGDTRSMILALKLNEITYIKEKKGEQPLLLLDDVFSELDENRQEQLLSHISEDIQTFITTTSRHIGSMEKRKKEVKFVEMERIEI